jgi:CBS domain-containing protein
VRTAGDAADSAPATVSSGESVVAAAREMCERRSSHALVRDEHSGRLVGMLSTLDVAGVLAGAEG